jgi:uncharacterized protein (DUF58 family)
MKRFYNKLIGSLFFTKLFYKAFVLIIVVSVVSYVFPVLLLLAQVLLAVIILLFIIDYVALFGKSNPVIVRREMDARFSNGDNNSVSIFVISEYFFPVAVCIIDEVPDQFQQRGMYMKDVLLPKKEKTFSYTLRPVTRGEYFFHNINVFLKRRYGFIERRIVTDAAATIKVYPSFFTLRNQSLKMRFTNQPEQGTKKVRKLGHSLEFEQIKEYVPGDDIRTLNWKATAKKGGQLMMNNYTDEKSQQVYCLVDKGRVMKMPFGGMTLLDYAINASVLLSHTALRKQDKSGLITFGDKNVSFLPADRKPGQMNNILDTLYAQQTNFMESDFERLYALVRTRITQRSLLVLFTNFESFSGLQRQLPYIKGIAKKHLLIVVFFENTELKQLADLNAESIEDVYTKTIAEKFVHEKRLIVKELQKNGVLSVLTSPKHVIVNTVNKYLEIKARQAI